MGSNQWEINGSRRMTILPVYILPLTVILTRYSPGSAGVPRRPPRPRRPPNDLLLPNTSLILFEISVKRVGSAPAFCSCFFNCWSWESCSPEALCIDLSIFRLSCSLNCLYCSRPGSYRISQCNLLMPGSALTE